MIKGSGSVSLTNWSGSGRPKNIRILQIRIRNTGLNWKLCYRRGAGGPVCARAGHARVRHEEAPGEQAQRGKRQGNPGRVHVGLRANSWSAATPALRRRRSHQSVDIAAQAAPAGERDLHAETATRGRGAAAGTQLPQADLAPAWDEHTRFGAYILLFTSFADPDPGSGDFLSPGSEWVNKSGSGSGMNNRIIFSSA